MNSRQINFFLTATDQAELLIRLGSKGDYVIVHACTQDERLYLLENAVVKEMGVEPLTVYLVRSTDIDAIQLNVVPNQPYKSIDVVRSPVIQFSRCYHAGGRLRRGRLYFVTAYYDGGEKTKKEKAFLKWAIDLITIARRNLLKEPGSLFYFGGDALRAKEAGTIIDRV
jgi:hypothetical protein